MAILPDRTELTTPADGDLYVSTDVSDTTDAAGGTDKKITWANIKAGIKTYYDSVTTTLTNKTLTSPVLNGTLSGTAFLDEDTMSSDSAIAAASQQSIKAYADTKAASAGAETISGAWVFEKTSGHSYVEIQKVTATDQAAFKLNNEAGNTRFIVGLSGVADDDLFIGRYDESGVWVGSALTIDAVSGDWTTTQDMAVGGAITGSNLSGTNTGDNPGLENLSEDTTPTLGGELDCGANSIGFTMQTATGDGTTTVDWKLGNHMDFTFGAFNETFTFTAPTKPGVYTMSLKQDSVGSRTATWPATVKWPAGTAPTLTTTATTGYDVVSFRYDGTNYYATSTLNFS